MGRGLRWLIGVLLLAALGVAAWYRPWSRPAPAATTLPDNSIAVLPFRNLGSTETMYFSEGVVEQIQSSLMLIEQLRVISRTSTLPYRQTTKPVARVARELGVNYLLEGSVLQVGRRLKLTVALIQAPENRVIWTNTYEGQQKELFSFTSEVARQVAEPATEPAKARQSPYPECRSV